MNNIKKISIALVLMWVFTPVLVFAEATPTKATNSDTQTQTNTNSNNKNSNNKTQLADPSGSGTSEKDPLIKCGNRQDMTINPQTGLPNDVCDINDVNKLLMDILKLIFLFAGFIVAGMFMYAGFLLITAAGNTGQIQKAKDIFKRVVIGFLIMFLSYIVIKNLLEHIGAIDFFKNLIT